MPGYSMLQFIEMSALFSTAGLAIPENTHQGLRQYPQQPTQGSAHSLRTLGQITQIQGQLVQANDSVSASSGRFSVNSATSSSSAGNPILVSHNADGSTLPQITLEKSGKPLFEAFRSGYEALGKILSDHLRKSGKTYQALRGEGQNQFLLDAQGHLVQLHHSPEAVVLVRSSQAQGAPAGAAQPQRLDCRPWVVGVENNPQSALPTLSRAHVAYLTGSHRDVEGRSLRLHEQQLYAFDDQEKTWRLTDLKFSTLLTPGNGNVYGQTEHALVDLSNPHLSRVALPGEVKACAVSVNQQLAVLSGDQSQRLQLFDLAQPAAPVPSVTLRLDNGAAQAKSIALSPAYLFICDTLGRLYSVKREDLDRPVLDLQPVEYTYPDGLSLPTMDGTGPVRGFLSGDQGQVHVLVHDSLEAVHALPVEGDQERVNRGWNLSNVLVLNSRSGLPTPPTPASDQIWDLEPVGRIGLSGQRLMRWDTASQAWAETGIEAEQLQCGLNGKAYLLQGGVLKKLDVGQKPHTLAFGGDHALSHRPQTTAVTVKDTLAGLEERTVSAFAMLNDKHFVVIDAQKGLTVHHPTGEPTTLDFPQAVGKPTALALDGQHRLYAITNSGDLFVMDKEAWQARGEVSRGAATWTDVLTPPGTNLLNIHTGKQWLNATFSENGVHRRMQLEVQPSDVKKPLAQMKIKWVPMEMPAADQNGFYDLSARLRGNELGASFGWGHTNPSWATFAGTARVNVSAGGVSGIENSIKVDHLSQFRAHIFKPTLETPRWAKTLAYYLQHQFQGRKGLHELYKDESDVFKGLQPLNSPAPKVGLQTRIEQLEIGPQGADLKKALQVFRSQLQESSLRTLTHLGQALGQSTLLKQQVGVLDAKGGVSAPSRRRDVTLKVSEVAQKLNISSSGHDLIKALKAPFAQLGAASDTLQLLEKLDKSGLRVSHQKVNVPLGRLRDAGDSQGLTKARLALDAMAVAKLAKLLDTLKVPVKLQDLQSEFEEIQREYEGAMIKRMTDIGFTDHASLEATYDGIKSVLNAFKKEDHALSVNLRSAMGSRTRVELKQSFKDTLRHLNPDDELSLQRSYGGTLSTPGLPVPAVKPSAGLGASRNYGLTAERVDKGLKICLLRDGVALANLGIAWRLKLGQPIDTDQWSLGFKSGVDFKANSSTTQRNAVEFIVPDEGIEQFVDGLFDGTLKPLDLLQKSGELAAQNSLRFNFDITTSVVAVEVGLDLKESPVSFNAGLAVNANLFTYGQHSVKQGNVQEQVQERSKNRPRLINSANVTLSAKGQLSASERAFNGEEVSAPIGGAVNVGVGVDNKTTKRTKFNFKQAVPLTAPGLQKLVSQMGSAYQDKSSQQQLKRLAALYAPSVSGGVAAENRVAYLRDLSTCFPLGKAGNNAQYAACQALQRAVFEQQGVEKNIPLLDSAHFESAYTDLTRLSAQGLVSKVSGAFIKNHTQSNAEHVAELLREDAMLKALVKQLQRSGGTLVKVRLELKDSEQKDVHRRTLEKDLTLDQLEEMLCDRSKTRIKAITVSQSASKMDGFTSPVSLLGYNSSATINVVKTLGKISFSYGLNESIPKSYALEGALANPAQAFKDTLVALRESGLELNS